MPEFRSRLPVKSCECRLNHFSRFARALSVVTPSGERALWRQARRNRNRNILRNKEKRQEMKTTSKTILITGASSGFGRDMAETLAADSHKVYAGVRDLAGRNSAAAVALRGKGVDALALDVTSGAEVQDGINSLLARSGGKLDVV